MGEHRGGEGPIASGTAVKYGMGRSFLRPSSHHVGQRADPTAWAARDNVDRVLVGQGSPPTPTKQDMELLFEENPKTVQTYRAAKMTDREIYDLLTRLH